MTDANTAIVIGAGHNGLVCAAYLARAGRKVLVLEAASEPGGAAITREFHPGFRVSAAAHLVHLFDEGIAQELALAGHGLEYAGTSLTTVALSAEGKPLVIDGASVVDGEVSAADRSALVEYRRRMQCFAALLARQHARIPPRIASGDWREAMAGAVFGLDIRRLGRRDMRDFLRIVTMPIQDVLDETFEDSRLKGALSLDGVLGMRLGPRSGGSVFAALHRASGAVGGRDGALALPRGGVGAVTTALAAAARAAGAEIRLSTPVAAIVMEGDQVAGVQLANGEQIAARTVISNADPKTTLLELLGARHLETEFARRVHHYRSAGNAAKLHLALAGKPVFRGVSDAHLGQRLVIAPDMRYVDEAFNPSKYREYSREPVFEITIPTLHDASLAPAGQHVLSAIVQYAPHDLAGGWDAGRAGFREATLAVLERHAPGLRALVIAEELLTPADLAREFRMSGGHWHHGELALDQALMLRPVPGAAQYAAPVNGLYLCGAGAHPGGGVMGHAGRNAARVVLAGRARP
jgi:phytoene dehydrogenase-like protein